MAGPHPHVAAQIRDDRAGVAAAAERADDRLVGGGQAPALFPADRVAVGPGRREGVAGPDRSTGHARVAGQVARVAGDGIGRPVEGADDRLHVTHPCPRQEHAGIEPGRAALAVPERIGVVGGAGEQRRPPAVVDVGKVPVRTPTGRGPLDVGDVDVAPEGVGVSNDGAGNGLAAVGTDSSASRSAAPASTTASRVGRVGRRPAPSRPPHRRRPRRPRPRPSAQPASTAPCRAAA